tara:strand:- start:1501 stop:2727 length:1227 start_codon:yes stop_codon:yes gene_type:complete
MNFAEFISEQKNTHMTHIEDKVIYGGVNGTRQAILALRSLRDTLGGNHAGSLSLKWDGAPAVFCGTDPRDGRFFVAKKGIFNKNPKVYKTDKDIDADTSGDLATKLKLSLKHFSSLGIKGVIQGDFLFGPGDLKKSKIKGKQYITFHPNTLIYAIPANTEMAKQVRSAKIGVVWHTTYTGDSFETMKASYGVKVSQLKQSKTVWQQDAMLRDMTKFTMTKKDTELVNGYLSQSGKIFNQISGTALRQLEANTQLAQHIETFNNTFVRKGEVVMDTNRHVSNLINWIKKRYNAEISKRTTEKGKAGQQRKLDELLNFFSPQNKKSLKLIFDLQKLIILVKLKLINILNKLNSAQTFVKTRKGYRTAGQEGYVAIDKLGGDAVKIVDRMEFSYNNFSPNILKGWDKPGRN